MVHLGVDKFRRDEMIELKDVVFSYPRIGDEPSKKTIDHLTFEVKKGEFVAILGHNGSGKSTLAKLLNGLLLPESGQVIIEGMTTSREEDLWKIRSKAGLVFQNPDNQIVATIVEEDVAFGAENLGVPKEELRQRVDRALETVDMLDYKRHAPHLLSGGQKQRVAIAGILAMEPDIVIFDEPTAMLDPKGQKEVIDTIQKLHAQKKTILLITHFMEEAALADRLIVMEKGRLVLDGHPKEVFSEVEEMQRIGLDVPQVTELAHRLKQDGFAIDDKVLTVKELVDQLCLS